MARFNNVAQAKAYQQTIELIIQRSLSPAAFGRQVAGFARKTRDELIAAGRASSRYQTFVDGAQNAPEENVQRNITYVFSNVAAVVEFCLPLLISGSPYSKRKKGTPHFRDSFFVAVNGTPIAAAAFKASLCPPDATVYIYNSQPYGRKIDVQRIGSHDITFSVPAGLFSRVVNQARRNFSKATSIQRIYSVTVPGQWVTRKGRLVEYPAIEIKPGIS